MHHSKLTLKEAADFLHLPSEDLKYLANKGITPVIKERGKIFFRKSEIKNWAVQSLFHEKQKKLGNKHFSAQSVWSKSKNDPNLLSSYINLKQIAVNVIARTKPSVLKELVNIAYDTCLLTDKSLLLQLLKEREDEITTGLQNGVAIPHSTIHPEYLFLESFIVVVKTDGAIPFGSLDGKKTDIFIMLCANCDEEHIFMLSRLASMIKKTQLINQIRETNSNLDILEIFKQCEQEIIS